MKLPFASPTPEVLALSSHLDDDTVLSMFYSPYAIADTFEEELPLLVVQARLTYANRQMLRAQLSQLDIRALCEIAGVTLNVNVPPKEATTFIRDVIQRYLTNHRALPDSDATATLIQYGFIKK